jgi:hypothetical protein
MFTSCFASHISYSHPCRTLRHYSKNCRRAGAGPFTVNYYIDLSSINLQDPKGVLKSYTDSNTISGNTIVRKFCGECGRSVIFPFSIGVLVEKKT